MPIPFQDRLKTAFAARKKEINQKDKLEKVKEKKPSDRHTIVSLSVMGWYLLFVLTKIM